jgi:hypothetical protein
MTNKEMKSEIRKIWIDQIKTAMNKADEAIEGCEDNGTCNFDMVMIKKESTFTYAETIEIFNECGIRADKMSEWGRHYSGYIGLPNYKGQGERNTKWAEAFGESLKEQGFEVSMYYQCD